MTEPLVQCLPGGLNPPCLALRLRHDTSEAHASVERLPVMVALMSDGATLDDYRRYLRIMAGVYSPLEERLYGALPGDLVERLGVRPKLPAVLRDLAEQGEAWTPKPMPARRHDPLEPLTPGNESALVGGLYVLEGATLGGRTIARHLARILGEAFGAGRLLDFHGRRTSRVWKHFSHELNALAESGRLDADSVVRGALATFGYVDRSLSQWA
ncbi:biliverdin-producing heme oxygenase [Thiorhodococcus minor]|uniref:Biliverdin-producing heme oxygenase n=1 Tax=Thiorhodococcus minor TaxID=57489 RepID=A0A6M0JT36_9GAMM|nr:biliverdin-producing heme oxygenase [Thiorhodococcus minor]NEV60686.1 biliverdin-producing heme oxygenase [Thiorhodococcus minor]